VSHRAKKQVDKAGANVLNPIHHTSKPHDRPALRAFLECLIQHAKNHIAETKAAKEIAAKQRWLN
jgi:hypothetical protein